MTVFTLQRTEIPRAWPWIQSFLDMVEDADWTAGEVFEDLLGARAQLWGLHDGTEPAGIWITRVENTPSKKFGLVWIAAGRGLEDGMRLFAEHTEPWLRDQGCEFVRVIGRKGWGKALHDYRETARLFEKELTHG